MLVDSKLEPIQKCCCRSAQNDGHAASQLN